MVIKTARARATTRRGVRYFFHPSLPREVAAGLSVSAGRGFVTGAADSAGTGEADIKFAPSAARNLQTMRYSNGALKEIIQSWLWTKGSCDVSCTSIIMLMRRSS